MSVILRSAFRRSFHEYDQLISERRRAFLDLNYRGPKLNAKIGRYRKMGQFHDADNCNTMFIHHLCRAFPKAKILLPIGSLHSFVRAHRVWGIMGPNDKNGNTRAFLNDPKWRSWPVVVRLAWLWGKRNTEAIKRSDKNRLLVFKIHDVSKRLHEIFGFIDRPITKQAIKAAKAKHNKLSWSASEIQAVENEMWAHRATIANVARPFKKYLSQWVDL